MSFKCFIDLCMLSFWLFFLDDDFIEDEDDEDYDGALDDYIVTIGPL